MNKNLSYARVLRGLNNGVAWRIVSRGSATLDPSN
jgi:hypothetical protein